MQHTYKIMLCEEPEVVHTVNVPALPGCITYGESVDMAITMVKDAIKLLIEEQKSQGEHIPEGYNKMQNSSQS